MGDKSKLKKLIEQKKADLTEVKACRSRNLATADARVEALEDIIKDLEEADSAPAKKKTKN